MGMYELTYSLYHPQKYIKKQFKLLVHLKYHTLITDLSNILQVSLVATSYNLLL